MSCITIQIASLPHSIPSDLTDNGLILVDLSQDFDLVTIVEDSEFTVDGFRNDSAVPATAPQTARNKAIFEPLIASNLFQREQCVYLEANILRCGLTLPFTHVRVTGRQDVNCQYTFEITNKVNNPLELAKQCMLCDIPNLGEFELTKANVEATWTRLQNGWTPGDECFVWPIEWFGNTYLSNQFTPEDLRPRFNPWALLQKGYCKLGVKLNTPFLDDPKWRRTWAYLSDSNFGGNANVNLDNFRFKANVEPFTFFPEDPIVVDDGSVNVPLVIETDPTGQIMPNGRVMIDPCIVQDFCFEYSFGVPRITLDDDLNIFINALYAQEQSIGQNITANIFSEIAQDVLGDQQYIEDPQNRVNVFTGKLTIGSDLFLFHSSVKETLLLNFRYLISRLAVNLPFQFYGGCFYNVPKKLKYCEGDIIQMSQTLDCNKSLFDLTEALIQMTGSKVEWKAGSRVLDIRPAFEVDGLEGHYIEDDIQDLTEFVIKDTLNNTALEKFQLQCQIKGFKKSSDPCITNDPRYQEEDQPYDKKIDFGQGFEEGCEEDRNKCFEPTVQAEVFSHIQPVGDDLFPVHLSCLTDNEPDDDGNQEISFDICWRIGIGYFVPQQDYLDEFGNILGQSGLNWCGELSPGIPSFIQLLDGENLGLPGINPEDCALVYGNHEEELWTKYLGREFVGRFLGNKVTFELHLCCADLFKIDARKMISISYQGFQYFGFMDIFQNRLCSERATLTLNSPNQVLGICLERPTGNGTGVEPIVCENFPEIDCEVIDGCIILMAGGTNESVIQEALFEYCLLVDDGNGNLTPEVDDQGEQLWNEAEATSNVSAQVCDLDCPAKIRMTVTYEGVEAECPDCPGLQVTYQGGRVNDTVNINISVPGQITATANGVTANGTNSVSLTVPVTNNPEPVPLSFTVTDQSTGCTYSDGATITTIEGQNFGPTIINIPGQGQQECEPQACPSITKVITKDPCGNNPTISIECELNEECKPCFWVLVSGDIQSMIDEITGSSNVGGLTFNIAADGLSAESVPICLETGDTFTLEELEISWQDPCKPFMLQNPLTRVKTAGCCCNVSGSCVQCLYSFDELCDYKPVWYQMKGMTDPTNPPFMLVGETPIVDNETKEEIKCSYPIYGPNGCEFEDQLKIWYVAILSKPGCDCILYSYFHNPFVTGGTPGGYTPPVFEPRSDV